MITLEIKYENLDGDLVTEKHDFHMRRKDLIRLQMKHEEGYQARIEEIVDSRNGDRIMEEFDMLIGLTVGKRVGDKFNRSEEYTREFLDSDVGSEFFVKLVTDAGYAAEWFNNVVPKKLLEETQQEADKLKADGKTADDTTEPKILPTAPPMLETSTDEDTAGSPEDTRTFEQYTRQELVEMPDEQYYKLLGTDQIRKMSKLQQSITMQRLNQAS